MRKTLSALVVSSAFVPLSAEAQVTQFISDACGTFRDVLGGDYVTSDIRIDFEGTLGGQQLYVGLTNGHIYNTPGTGTNTAPAGAFVSLVPELEFDTFVTLGGPTAETSSNVLVVGGAVNIRGAPSELVTGPDELSVAWAPAPGTDIASATDFLVTRITMSTDAEGSLYYAGSTIGSDIEIIAQIPIINGEIGFCPEPTSALLFVLAASCFGSRTMRRVHD